MTIRQHSIRSPSSIADDYCDLLAQLGEGKRQGMIRRLAVGFYDGWAPSRAELAVLVDFELGRITEEEFFATRLPATPVAADGARCTDPRVDADPAATGPVRVPTLSATQLPTSTNPGRKAAFNVDCGELARCFRFVATRLRGAGWTIRDAVNYRLVFLDYVLLPVVPTDRQQIATGRPAPFDATILCVPDLPAPWSAADGRSSRHIIGPQGISGSRGPWPVPTGVRLIKFVISRQPALGARPSVRPAGVLLVDLVGGRASWKPVTDRLHQHAAQS